MFLQHSVSRALAVIRKSTGNSIPMRMPMMVSTTINSKSEIAFRRMGTPRMGEIRTQGQTGLYQAFTRRMEGALQARFQPADGPERTDRRDNSDGPQQRESPNDFGGIRWPVGSPWHNINLAIFTDRHSVLGNPYRKREPCLNRNH